MSSERKGSSIQKGRKGSTSRQSRSESGISRRVWTSSIISISSPTASRTAAICSTAANEDRLGSKTSLSWGKPQRTKCQPSSLVFKQDSPSAELVDRNTQRLALDVPQGNVHGRDRSQNSVARGKEASPKE